MTAPDPTHNTKTISHKVAAYVTHEDRLLVFHHTHHPEAGIQIPAGTVAPDESPEAAALRETREESGLEALRLRAYLGRHDLHLSTTGRTEVHRRYFYHLEFIGASPERWISYESDPSDGSPAPIELEFYWVKLIDEIPPLSGEQDAMLPALRASLSTQFIVNVEGVIYHGDRYLIIQRGEAETHAPGILTLPGGKVEGAGVSANILESTLLREILEEVGLEVGPHPVYLESKSFITDAGQPVVDVVFLCRYQSGMPRIDDPGEVAGIQWMTAGEILSHADTPPWTRHSIQLAEQKRLERGE